VAKAKAEPTNADYAKLLTPLLAGTPMPALARGPKEPNSGVFPKDRNELFAAMLEKGYIEEIEVIVPGRPGKSNAKGKPGKSTPATVANHIKLTPTGKDFVLHELGGRELLSSLPRLFEKLGSHLQNRSSDTGDSLHSKVESLEHKLKEIHTALEAIRAQQKPDSVNPETALKELGELVSRVANRPLRIAVATDPATEKAIEQIVRVHHSQNPYCPFDHLFTALQKDYPLLTIGQFHDTLRKLHDEGTVRVSAWTKLIDDAPRSELMFLISNRHMYFASVSGV